MIWESIGNVSKGPIRTNDPFGKALWLVLRGGGSGGGGGGGCFVVLDADDDKEFRVQIGGRAKDQGEVERERNRKEAKKGESELWICWAETNCSSGGGEPSVLPLPHPLHSSTIKCRITVCQTMPLIIINSYYSPTTTIWSTTTTTDPSNYLHPHPNKTEQIYITLLIIILPPVSLLLFKYTSSCMNQLAIGRADRH